MLLLSRVITKLHKSLLSKYWIETRGTSDAHCNLSMIYYKTCDAKLSKHLKAIEDAKITEPQDMHKIALMYCEISYHEKAYKWFQNLLSFQPYDIRILHFCGLAAYNYGLYSKSA